MQRGTIIESGMKDLYGTKVGVLQTAKLNSKIDYLLEELLGDGNDN